MNDEKSLIASLQSENINLKKRISELEKQGHLLKSEFNKLKILSDTLEESKEQFRALYDNAPLSYQSLNADGYIIDINPAWLRTLGYNREKVLGKKFGDFLHPDWKLHFEKNFTEFKKLGCVSDVQFKIKHKDGRYLDISFEGCIGYHPDGRVKQTYCVFQDITEQKKAEMELIDSENRYRKLFDNHGATKLIIDSNTGNIVEANKAAAKFYGWSKDELTTMNIFQINTMSRDKIQKEMDKASSHQKQYFEFKHRKANGTIADVAVYSNPLIVNDKTLLHSIIHDITDRKLAETEMESVLETLHLEKENMTKIFKAMKDGVYIVNQEYDIEYVNPVLVKDFGIYEGKKCYDYFHDLKEICTWCKNDEVFQGKTVRWEWISDKNGKTYDLIDTPLTNPDGTISKLEIFRDITERKRAEQDLLIEKEFSEKIIETSNAIIIGLDKNHLIRIFNKGAEKISGYTKNEVIGKDWFEIFLPTEQLDEMKKVWKSSWGIPSHSYYNPIIIKRGVKRIISWQTTGMYEDEDEKNHLLISIGEDITERKIIEQELKESKLKYQLLADYTYDWEYWIDPNGNYIYISPSVERTTGYTSQEFKTNPDLLFNIVREDFKEKISAHYKDENNIDQPVYSIEFPIITKSGEEKWISHICSPVFDKSGSWVGRRGNNRDITERIISEKRLRKSEYLLNETQKISKLGGWEYRLSDGQIIWTDETYNIHGLPIAPVKDVLDGIKYYHKDDRPIITKAFKECVNKGTPYNLELRFKNAQNKEMCVHTSGKPIYKDGKITKVFGNFMDITERMKTEEMLKVSEEKHRALYENAPLSYQSLNADGCFIDINPAWVKTLGYNREEVIGKKFEDFLHPDWKSNFERNFPEFKKRGGTSSVHFKIRHKDGSYLDALFEGNIGYYPDGSVKQTYCVFQDITEQKKAEMELISSEKRYHELFDEAPIALWEEDFSLLKIYIDELKNRGIKDFRKYFEENPKELNKCAQKIIVKDVNRATLEMHKAKNKEELKGNLDKTFTPKSYDVLKEEIIAFSVGQDSFESEAEVKTLTGEVKNIYIKFYFSMEKVKGENNRALIAINDITERKQAEEKLKKRMLELDNMNKFFINRESRMVDLKSEINKLLEKLGEAPKYDVPK